MQSVSLSTLADEQLAVARDAPARRAAHTVHGGQGCDLRQAVLALLAGCELRDHESPGEATLQVLRGQVKLSTATETWEGGAGDLVTIPAGRHSLAAIEDAAVVLTVVRAH
ncbi:cupin domain-containing protein [Microlunatus ginsengisoli]|uniref:Cupin domain-containing protein n=1 Tax=Microlunatus ginsengisoli TaxID=363863 RepID=A0ABP7AUJ2_9ACTN